MLQIYNSLTQNKEEFKPINEGKVGIYVCGMTVYDDCHIGHARMLVVFDMITRYLRWIGYDVNYVRNITDIDDKIIKRAHENNESIQALTERVIASMNADLNQLNVLSPDHEPRATQYIPNMVKLIEQLVAKDLAYVAANGDLCYRVNSFKSYGQLAHQDLEKLRAGARIEIDKNKGDPLDFVLWKIAKPEEPSWDSPWGKGRPGWHIECSAMSLDCLGNHFDIHGGGIDLLFPHHQNEIAQSEGATGVKFVNTWIHNGFVQIEKEKMSKSLGNFFTIKEVLTQFPAEVIRYFLLASHYRSPVNYSQENLYSVMGAVERFYIALRGIPKAKANLDNEYVVRFKDAMNDDFNTPIALAVLFDLAREINRLREQQMDLAAPLAATLRELGGVLGLLQQNPEIFLQQGVNIDESKQIEALITARNKARAEKNWQEADRLRQELTNLNIVIEDSASGTIWRKIN